ncbi:MAG TPA: hypothetical protein VGQ22_18810 [Steroidobacteraceae bacterium]|nr:hypothetical protein [Steroidobacteraceae bacterium]
MSMVPARFKLWQYLAVAAVAILGALGVFLLTDNAGPQPLMVAEIAALPHGRATVIASSHAILRTRGSAVDAEIPLPPVGQAIELRVLPEFTASPHYRIRLFRMTADDSLQPLAELGGLTTDDDSFLTVFVDAARLRPGSYRLVVVGDVGTNAVDKENAFILRLRPALTDPSARSR